MDQSYIVRASYSERAIVVQHEPELEAPQDTPPQLIVVWVPCLFAWESLGTLVPSLEHWSFTVLFLRICPQLAEPL